MIIRLIKALVIGAIMPPLLGLVFFGSVAFLMFDVSPLVFWYDRLADLQPFQVRAYALGAIAIAIIAFASLPAEK